MKTSFYRGLIMSFAMFSMCLSAFSQDFSNVKGISSSNRDVRHVAYVSGGGSNIYSHVYASYGSAAATKIGGEWNMGYDCVFKDFIGFGLLYNGYVSTDDTYLPLGSDRPSKVDLSFYVHTLAPQFVMDFARDSSRWAFTMRVGMGVSIIVDKAKNDGKLLARERRLGFAVTTMIGAEYRITRNISVMASLDNIMSHLGRSKRSKDYDCSNEGIARVGIDLGIKYRF